MPVSVTSLAAHHRALLERGSLISAGVIVERRAWTAETWQALTGLGFRGTQKRPECFPGLVLPQWAVDGENVYAAVRWDTPRRTPGGKLIRYDVPAGTRLRLDVPPRCRSALADPTLPLWLTEGSKKADALASAGLVSVNVPGVWSWRTPSVQADFDSIVLRDRRVVVCFDSDMLTSPKVRLATVRLGRWLQNRRADVRIVDWRRALERAK